MVYSFYWNNKVNEMFEEISHCLLFNQNNWICFPLADNHWPGLFSLGGCFWRFLSNIWWDFCVSWLLNSYASQTNLPSDLKLLLKSDKRELVLVDTVCFTNMHFSAIITLSVFPLFRIADNMLIVHSRLVMLDGPLLFFTTASLLCYLKFHKESKRYWMMIIIGLIHVYVRVQNSAFSLLLVQQT